MFSSFLSIYQRWAARRMFGRWAPLYDIEVTENNYSGPDAVATEALKRLAPNVNERPKIADVGIGTGLLAQQIYDALPCRIIGLDFSEDMLAVAASRDVTELLIKCDVGKDMWPIESGSCDMVVSAGLLEYLTPEMLSHYFQEARRVLRKDGILVCSYKPREPHKRGINLWPGHSGTYLTCSYVPSDIEGALHRNRLDLLYHSEPFKGCVYSDGTYYDYRLVSARSSNS